MASTPVVGSGPVDFMDETTGQQLSIPISELAFTNNQIDASKWPLYNKHKLTVDAILAYLVSSGALTPAPAPPPVPALVLTAKQVGAAGNNIQVTFSNVGADPNDPAKFDASLTETDTWKGLTKDTIEKVVGTAAGGSLVFVTATSAVGRPRNQTYSVAVVGDKFKVFENDGVTEAFELNARTNDPEAKYTTVIISNVNAVDQTDPHFDMTATWQKSAAGIHVTPDLANEFAYEVAVAGPNGGAPGVPANGSVVLRGGAEAAPASAASAIVSGPS
jgi:hypothetical protein